MTDPVLTMIPGPTPVHPDILRSLSLPTTSHVAPGFVTTYRRCLERLRAVVRGKRGLPFVVAGSGTGAMEMALINTLSPGERLLVVSQGYFGDRWAQIAETFGISCESIRAEWGRTVPPSELEARLAGGEYAAVATTHVDTSTGAAAPLSQYAGLLAGRRELFLVDGVCATAGMDERFDEWGVDVLVTGAQKALGAPPGVAILMVSARALDRRRALAGVPGYTADLLRWLPIMENPAGYFSTPPVNEIVALDTAFGLILDEGLDERFARHRRLARSLREGMAALGLRPFTEAASLADTLSVLRYPAGVEDGPFRQEMALRKVIVAAALGPLAGQAFRVGHMGNIGVGEMARTLAAAEASLIALGRDVVPGTALAAAARGR